MTQQNDLVENKSLIHHYTLRCKMRQTCYNLVSFWSPIGNNIKNDVFPKHRSQLDTTQLFNNTKRVYNFSLSYTLLFLSIWNLNRFRLATSFGETQLTKWLLISYRPYCNLPNESSNWCILYQMSIGFPLVINGFPISA